MSSRAAGILLHRSSVEAGAGAPVAARIEVLIAHMGGPFWARTDEGGWSIPKGLVEPDEDDLAAARREFAEELGHPLPDVELRLLGEFRVRSGKQLVVFTAEGDLDVSEIASNTFELEWPPHSGRLQEFPEMDAAAWFDLAAARRKVVAGQVPVLDALEALLAHPAPEAGELFRK